MKDKRLFWSLRLAIGILGVVAIYNLLQNLIEQLSFLVTLYRLTDVSPEFRLMLVAISIFINCKVIVVVIKIIDKLQSLIEEKTK